MAGNNPIGEIPKKVIANIKGFSKTEIFNLYYCSIVISNRIGTYVSNEKAMKDIKVLKDVDNNLPTIIFATGMWQEIVQTEQDKKTDVLACTKVHSKMLSFLNHFRNAIAHGLISKKDGYVTLRDYNPTKKRNSAYGKIKANTIKSIVDLLLQIELK